MAEDRKGQSNIAGLVDAATAAFVTLAISGIVIATTLDIGKDIVTNGTVNDSWYTANSSDSSLVNNLSTDVEDGMVQLAGLIILLVVIVVLGFLRRRA